MPLQRTNLPRCVKITTLTSNYLKRIPMSQKFSRIFGPYKEMSVRYDRDQEALWCYFKPSERPCFSPIMLNEFRQIQRAVISFFKAGKELKQFPVRYMVLASQAPGVFNLGGDLHYYRKLIQAGNRERLLEYANEYIDICCLNSKNLNLPLTTISFVQGSAFGGGFELAMSSNYLIAEKHSQMGLPEIRFNLFPGMGAYSILVEKMGMVQAEQMTLQGEVHSSPELFNKGIIDVLAESGLGADAVDCFIRRHRRFANGLRSVHKIRQIFNPVSHYEMMDIAQIWVDVALQLKEKDMREMAHFILKESGGHLKTARESDKVLLIRTKQDRRISLPDLTFPLIDGSGKKVLHDRRRNTDRREFDTLQVNN
jgi:DSF synthase